MPNKNWTGVRAMVDTLSCRRRPGRRGVVAGRRFAMNGINVTTTSTFAGFAGTNKVPPPGLASLPGTIGERPAVTIHLAEAGSVSLFRSTPGGPFDAPGAVWLSVSPAPAADRVGVRRQPMVPTVPAEPTWMDEDPERWDGLS